MTVINALVLDFGVVFFLIFSYEGIILYLNFFIIIFFCQ